MLRGALGLRGRRGGLLGGDVSPLNQPEAKYNKHRPRVSCFVFVPLIFVCLLVARYARQPDPSPQAPANLAASTPTPTLTHTPSPAPRTSDLPSSLFTTRPPQRALPRRLGQLQAQARMVGDGEGGGEGVGSAGGGERREGEAAQAGERAMASELGEGDANGTNTNPPSPPTRQRRAQGSARAPPFTASGSRNRARVTRGGEEGEGGAKAAADTHVKGTVEEIEECVERTGMQHTMGMDPEQNTRVAVVVPFRDADKAATKGLNRTQQLDVFQSALTKLLAPSGFFHILVIEQAQDDRKFNIGKLKNVGFDLASKDPRDFGFFVLSDVDMLPDCDLVPYYRKFPERPMHLAARGTRYTKQMSHKFKPGATFLGAVASFNRHDFAAANGYPNTFWGWGGDDDELLDRLHDVGITVDVPDEGRVLDLENLTVQAKMRILRDEHGRFDQRNAVRERHAENWRDDGLSTLEYSVVGERSCGPHCTVVTVEL